MGDIDEWRERLTIIARRALAGLEGRLDSGSKALVDEFIDNFEFEVAMEWMHGAALRDNPLPLGPEERGALDALAAAMGRKPLRDGEGSS